MLLKNTLPRKGPVGNSQKFIHGSPSGSSPLTGYNDIALKYPEVAQPKMFISEKSMQLISRLLNLYLLINA